MIVAKTSRRTSLSRVSATGDSSRPATASPIRAPALEHGAVHDPRQDEGADHGQRGRDLVAVLLQEGGRHGKIGRRHGA